MGWFALTSVVAWSYLRICGGRAEATVPKANKLTRLWAALPLLPYFLESIAWAIRRRKLRYIGYSLLAPVAVFTLARRQTKKEKRI